MQGQTDWKELVAMGIEMFESQAELARAIEAELDPQLNLHCTASHVWTWLNRAEEFPPKYAMAFERATGIQARELCPGVFD